MNNSESFQRELDLLDSGSQAPTDLSTLQNRLRGHAADLERSDQHQIWAWTRLREELKSSPRLEPSSIWKRWLMPSMAGIALFLLGAYLLVASRSDLSIDSTGLNLYAQTFKTGDAQVVWVTGYSYIPSSTPLK
jgi:hypothetical protein